MKIFALPFAALSLSGCVIGTIAHTAVDVATLPAKIVTHSVDAVTTSQAEADENRGRELRKQDEQRGRELRDLTGRCRRGRPLPNDDCRIVQPR